MLPRPPQLKPLQPPAPPHEVAGDVMSDLKALVRDVSTVAIDGPQHIIETGVQRAEERARRYTP